MVLDDCGGLDGADGALFDDGRVGHGAGDLEEVSCASLDTFGVFVVSDDFDEQRFIFADDDELLLVRDEHFVGEEGERVGELVAGLDLLLAEAVLVGAVCVVHWLAVRVEDDRVLDDHVGSRCQLYHFGRRQRDFFVVEFEERLRAFLQPLEVGVQVQDVDVHVGLKLY